MKPSLCAVLLSSLASLAQAATIPFGPDLSAQGWKPLTFRSIPPVQFRADGASRLTLRADKAASVIWRGLDENLWSAKSAQWRWRVESSVPATDLTIKGKDDRALALYFVFAKDEAAARSAKGSSSLTSAMWWSSGAALVYVWGGNVAPGAVLPSPHMGTSGKLVVRQVPARADGKWVPEKADLAADFRRAFGRQPGPLVGIAVSSDSDDTGGLNVAGIEA
ncbi:MAG: DUF3047 domain-containing protein, partial [Bosea sp. (in: a-proteobacteria)]